MLSEAMTFGPALAMGDPRIRARGTAEKVCGKVQRKVGDIKRVFGK
jgi:uncharacterized protein YjbJ (UPF0337 family)